MFGNGGRIEISVLVAESSADRLGDGHRNPSAAAVETERSGDSHPVNLLNGGDIPVHLPMRFAGSLVLGRAERHQRDERLHGLVSADVKTTLSLSAVEVGSVDRFEPSGGQIRPSLQNRLLDEVADT